jgi:hypothetical protein
MPKLATLWVPKFVTLWDEELHQLLHCLRLPLITHVYLLIRVQADFKTGHFMLGDGPGYDRLMELCSPPKGERGRPPEAPSRGQVRRAVDLLIKVGLLGREGDRNAAQGQLRLWHWLPVPEDTLRQLSGRVSGRLMVGANPIRTRPPARSKAN